MGLTSGESYMLPLTQADLAAATGLSPVHVNRMLQELRGRGLVVLRSRQVTIPDLDALSEIAIFNPAYLHLQAPGHR